MLSIDSAVEAMRLGARDYLTKPINSGMEEHEQNGVTAPKTAAVMLPDPHFNRDILCLKRAGSKKDLRNAMTVTTAKIRNKIFSTS